jgi:hypothetical protein
VYGRDRISDRTRSQAHLRRRVAKKVIFDGVNEDPTMGMLLAA